MEGFYFFMIFVVEPVMHFFLNRRLIYKPIYTCSSICECIIGIEQSYRDITIICRFKLNGNVFPCITWNEWIHVCIMITNVEDMLIVLWLCTK